VSFAGSAYEDVVIGGIGYERVGDGVCQAYATPYLSTDRAVIKRSVVFKDDNGSSETCGVHRIKEGAFKGTGIRTLAVEEPQGDGYTRMVVFKDAFRDCKALTTVELPSDVLTVVVNCFNGCASLSTVVCRATEVPTAFYSTAGVADFDAHNHVVLYVPDGSVGKYADAENPSDKYGFWSSFDVRPLSEYSGGGDGPVDPVKNDGVELRLPLGTLTMLDAAEGDRVLLTPDPGSRLVSVYFNDEDLTDRVDNGVFYVPPYSGRAVIRPVFELSELQSADNSVSPVKLRIEGYGVEVDGLGTDDFIMVSAIDGRVVYQGRPQRITLSAGSYIIRTPGATFKFAI